VANAALRKARERTAGAPFYGLSLHCDHALPGRVHTNGPAASLAALYTEDAVLMPPNVQHIAGADAIGKFWSDHIKDGHLKNHSFEIVSINRDRKYAYQVASWTLDVINDKGETAKRSGNTVRIFERQTNGKWLTKVHIYNY
jgi:ketosteroid isomerase-like protein